MVSYHSSERRGVEAVAKPKTDVSRAVIITALEVEYLAVRSHLHSIKDDEHPKGTQYEKGIFKCAAGPWEVGIVEAGQGNEGAALHVERAIEHFSPEVILFVGVAGGIKDVTLGDVVAVTKAYGYEAGKAEKEFKPRPEVWRSTARMEQLARAQAKRRTWLVRLGRARPKKDPSVILGSIAAGEKVVASKRSQTYHLIKDMYGDALGVEKEGSGFLHAAHENAGVDALVIRGISDLIDGKNKGNEALRQRVAARNAAAFAFEVLAKLTRTAARQPKTSRRTEVARKASEAHRDGELAARPAEATEDQDEGVWKAPPIWNVPRLRNLNFTGRSTQLKELHTKLASHTTTALTALRGTGGVGKTQLATEYAFRHASDYEAVWWVRSDNAAQFASDYAGLAIAVGAVGADEADQQVQIGAAKAWLERNSDWLLILDNVPSPDEIKDYLPSKGTGDILITSRFQNWGSVADTVSIDKWPRDDSINFLLSRTGLDDKDAAYALAEELGDLPLALEHVGAYVEETGCSLGQYLELFKKRRGDMIALAKPPPGYDDTVATTWGLSFDMVAKESHAAVELLNLCAFFAPDDIPLGVIREGAEFLPAALAAAAGDDLEWNEALAALRSYSLAEISEDALSIHRLVQAVIQARLDEDESKAFAEAAVAVINGAFPFDSDFPEMWPICGRLAPHALTASGHAAERNVSRETAGTLLNQLGGYQMGRLLMDEARVTFERALEFDEAAYGPDDRRVAIRLNGLGLVLGALGDPVGARAHFERALKITETAYGPDDARLASSLTNLGMLLMNQRELAEAQPLLERALRLVEEEYGPDHPRVANHVNNLGGLLQNQHDLVGARKHYERALEIDEAEYGPDHHTVAIRLNNLGGVLRDQGDIVGARERFGRALHIFRRTFGDDHPSTVNAEKNLRILTD